MSFLLFTAVAHAGAPAFIPVQGVLSDAQGVAVDGPVEATFRLYASESGPAVLWSETRTVQAARGLFGVNLGQVTPLPLSLFAGNGELWLGIQVGSDPEMSRIHLGSAPFAAFAEYVGGNGCSPGQIMKWSGVAWVCADDLSVPAGAVMSFNLPICPAGWHELGAARGRSIVGLSPGGTLSGTQGAALGDLATRAIAEVPSHAHQVDPPAVSSDTGGNHAHGVTDPGHRHGIPTWVSNGGPNYNVLWQGSGMTINYNEQSTSVVTNLTVQQGGDHAHTSDIGAFASAAAGAPAVDVTMPYLQLLVCQKD